MNELRNTRVIDIASDRPIPDPAYRLIDCRKRDEEPLTGLYRFTEAVLDRQIELFWSEYLVEEVLQLDPVDVRELIRRYNINA